MRETYDVAVIGAGVFGAWTARHLQQAGRKVVLLDAYGPGNARASSGGESRVIRIGYGADRVYSEWSLRSLKLWSEFFERTGRPLLERTGVLWMAREKDDYVTQTRQMLASLKVPHEILDGDALRKRYPQINFDRGPVTWGLLEPESGAILARRAVQALAHEFVAGGGAYVAQSARVPSGRGRIDVVVTEGGDSVAARQFVFACGPWLPKLFPELLGERIYPTRQEVIFIGCRPGDTRYAPPGMPTWIDFGDEIYGLPDLEHRGFKIAPDRHGPAFDPDSMDRFVTGDTLKTVREYVAARFPGLRAAPIVETRVCQYENTSNGDFLIDRHPEMENVWLLGGGSGHGFKHGPAVGEYTAARVMDGKPVEARFSLATKATVQRRTVF